MELEAENWYLESTSHDFDDKRKFIKKYYIFLIENSSGFGWDGGHSLLLSWLITFADPLIHRPVVLFGN